MMILTTGGVLAASAIFLIPMTPFSIAAHALTSPGIGEENERTDSATPILFTNTCNIPYLFYTL